MKKMFKNFTGGGGYAKKNKSPKGTFKSFVALGLSSLLPSFAFSSESDEALTQLLSTTPSNPNDSKVQTLASYSPVVDLRTSRASTNIGPLYNGVFNENANLTLQTGLVTSVGSLSITANNQSEVTIDVTASQTYDYGPGSASGMITNANVYSMNFAGNGTIIINATQNATPSEPSNAFFGTYDHRYGTNQEVLNISSRFIFRASGNLGSFLTIASPTDVTGSGRYVLNSPYIEIDMKNGDKNKATKKYAIYSMRGSSDPSIYINAQVNNPNQVVNQQAVTKITGDIYTTRGSFNAHFTTSDSFLEGTLSLGSGRSVVTFTNGSSMRGDIDTYNDSNNGTHFITFNGANFSGTIKDSSNHSRSTNTSITFSNTAGQTFGNGTNDIVDKTYKGNIIGLFDLSANSTTTINGGSDGSKGFQGNGTNTLIFDFKDNIKTDATQTFTIGGGNVNSIYAMNGFTQRGQNQLDLSNLDNSNTLYKKLENAGIKVAVDATSQTTNNHLNGTLFFQKTNIQVGNDTKALFATKDNIVGSRNDLNGLALGAMFGNAIWNDENNDGVIIQDEIVANANGVSYQLTNGTNPSDSKASNGNIGKANDNIKKQVAFIFADGTEQNGYVFGGGSNDKQGYSGTIAGGTADSKYYFANAGYIGRSQIENAEGALVLFNTAFRGDLGVGNKDVDIMLDFSENRNGLRAESGTDSYANIVGAGRKNITFNFTKNTKQVKYGGAVVGDSTKVDSTNTTTDDGTAKYTMVNLTKYSSDDVKDNNGELKNSTSGTLIEAIRGAGLSGFNDTSADNLSNKNYGTQPDNTNTSEFSTTKTTLALRGTSLDATNITFKDYIYDFAFGEGLGEFEGVKLDASKLKGTIDLTASSYVNNNTGHSFIFKGTAIDGEAGVLATAGKLAEFSYDDSTATYDQDVTFKLKGLDQPNYVSNTTSNKVKGDSLIFTQTSLEGDLWTDNSVAVNLDFRDGRTWTMDESGIYLRGGSSIVVNGKVSTLSNGGTPSSPTLKLAVDSTQNKIELINTGMTLKLLDKGSWDENKKIANSFALRGTTLNTYWNGGFNGSKDGFHGYADSGINLVFAKGTNLETTMAKSNGSEYYKITDKEVDEVHTGSYSNGVYDGNYIAESTSIFTKLVTRSINAVFVGEDSYSASDWGDGGKITETSSFAFVNAGTDSNKLDGSKLVKLLTEQNSTITITLEGTSLKNSGSGIVADNKGATTFNMIFVKGSNAVGSQNTYIGTKYEGISQATRANRALSDSILKVAESSLEGGIDFKQSNFNVLFVGDNSQSLSDSSVFKGGTANSKVTFRDSNLNAGNGTTSSIQNIKGTIAFDLSHASEDMQISGTLKNMFASGGKYQTHFTISELIDGETITGKETIENLIFINTNQAQSSSTLATLLANGMYFNDSDTFGDLSIRDYEPIGNLKYVSNSSNLTLANGSVIALNGANTEIVFIGADSHGFDESSVNVSKLGDSTGSTLTFIDAGNLKLENIVNIDTNGDQQGKGTINLIGTTNFDLGNEATKTLTLYNANTQTPSLPSSRTAITGAGITINAIFTGSNPLGGTGTNISGGDNTITGASTANIGQVGEQTIYHILFDYTSSNLTFGTHHAYTGNIYGLTSDSVIKFKNAGYINGTQIENTQATILVDNTQIKGDFKGDRAILDFRNGNPAIFGNIISSSDTKLSQKELTFDLTGTLPKTTRTAQALTFTGNIQAGNRIAPNYADNPLGQSILTFQNAPTMTLGNDSNGSNPSSFIKSLANDVGFSRIGSAKIDDTEFATDKNSSYILKGTKLVFEGTSIDATNLNSGDILETTYDLDLRFDNRDSDRGNAGLGGTLEKSILTADSIVMGNTTGNEIRNLALTFKGVGSLDGATKGNLSNVLDVKLIENARFDLTASSSNGNIGTIILSKNTNNSTMTALTNVSKDSSLSIGAGSMNFIGNFSQSDIPTTTGVDAGAINVTFDGTNKAYGVIAGRGAMSVTISGDALFSDTQAKALGYAKNDAQFADLVIDFSNAISSSSSISLAHSSGMVGIVGQSTTLNLSQVLGDVALKGSFNLTEGANFGANSTSNLKVADNLSLTLGAGKTLSISEEKLIVDNVQQPKPTIAIQVVGGANNTTTFNSLSFVNLGDKIANISITNTDGWGVGGNWNIRGTNITLTAISSEYDGGNGFSKSLVFAKGSGTQTSQSNLTLSELTTNDKIANSSLTLSGDATVLDSGSVILIGRESLAGNPETHKLDGSNKNSKKTFIGLYNTILKSGDVLLDNSNTYNWGSGFIADDDVTIRGTDIFNLSATKGINSRPTNGNASEHPNNSTINAVFVNDGSTTTGEEYIANSSYFNSYATNDAGGALSDSILKTLKSKAYGNITLDDTVTATIKFVGENSHSFDGKTKVNGSRTSATFSYSIDNSTWKQIAIGDGTNGKANGVVYVSDTSASGGSLATLSGGNATSEFHFDHTSVSLDQVKNAGGSTYVYNSNIIGQIAVNNTNSSIPANSSTTIFFNQAYSGSTPSAVTTFAQKYRAQKGINLDLGVAHQLKSSHLDGGKLTSTSKTTNIILLGAKAFEGSTDNSINLSFLPDMNGANASENYNYTIVSGGVINFDEYRSQLVDQNPTGSNSNAITGQTQSIFGNSKVYLIDTVVVGTNTESANQFINVEENTQTVWGGGEGVDQFLIFNFNDGYSNQKLYGGRANAIRNTSKNSRYIFSSIFEDSSNPSSSRVLTLGSSNQLKNAINSALGSTQVIADGVVGYLGLRGISVLGDINENINGVDIVFNSTDNLAYREDFDFNGEHYYEIVEGENLVSTDAGDDSIISGYATLRVASNKEIVSIKGSSNKEIVFIGDRAVEGGFEKLKIEEGSINSHYTFHTVGELSQTFLSNIGLYQTNQKQEAVAGNFTFVNSSIVGNINANHNGADTSKSNTLTFKNVKYTGNISGNLNKNLSFAQGSDHISITGGSNSSVYDFSALNQNNQSIHLEIDLSNGVHSYYASEIKGFDGNLSLIGSLQLATQESESGVSAYSNSFAFNNEASWEVTRDSRVMNLSLGGNGTHFNLDLNSAPRNTQDPSSSYRTLEVGKLSGNQGQILMGTAINTNAQETSSYDKIEANMIEGSLYVTAQDATLEQGSFDAFNNPIVLIHTQQANASIEGNEVEEGLVYVSTQLDHQVKNGSEWESVKEEESVSGEQRWVLTAINNDKNQTLIDESTSLITNPYRMLLIETNNLNKRMGELRGNEYSQGAWIRIFNGSDSGEGSKNLYTNIQLGYDYGFGVSEGKNYLGVAFSTSIVDLKGDSFSGKSNTYSFALYNSYIAECGLYVDSIAKYLYTNQTINPNEGQEDGFGNHAFSLGVEVGYQAYIAKSDFYLEPQAELIYGYIQGVKDIDLGIVGSRQIWGELENTNTLYARAGVVAGYTFKTQSGFSADLRIGASFVNEYVGNASPLQFTDGYNHFSEAISNDMKALINVGTNLILTDQWRVYIDAEKSFGGKRNIDYQANIGARFSFGEKTQVAEKLEKPLPLKLKDDNEEENPQGIENKESKENKESSAESAETTQESKERKDLTEVKNQDTTNKEGE